MIIKEKLLPLNQFSRPGYIRAETLGIVYHWTGAAGQENYVTRRFFELLAKQDEKDDKPDHYGSAHYIIGIDGEIIRCIPDDEVAYHVGAASYTDLAKIDFPAYTTNKNRGTPNWCMIGIEMCHKDWSGEFTDETLRSAIELGVLLLHQNRIPPGMIYRHYDITGKLCPKWFVEHEMDWTAFKTNLREEL